MMTGTELSMRTTADTPYNLELGGSAPTAGRQRPRVLAALVCTAALLASCSGGTGKGGFAESSATEALLGASDDGPVGFDSLDELVSVSRAVVELRIVKRTELVPLPSSPDGEVSPYAYQLYDAEVTEILATLDDMSLEVGSTISVGAFAANPNAASSEIARSINEYSTTMLPDEVMIGFLDTLADVGMPQSFTFVRSDLGRFSVTGDDEIIYEGDVGALAEFGPSRSEIEIAARKDGLLGSAFAAEDDSEGTAPAPREPITPTTFSAG